MQKFTHLHAKIRSVRKRKGLQQKDFIVEVSEKLGLPKPLTPGLASQWESNLTKSRTTPSEEQLAAIAELTTDPVMTMAWFMNDNLPAESPYEFYPDGSFSTGPFDDIKESEAIPESFLEGGENYGLNGPIEEVSKWRKDPRHITSLRQFIFIKNPKRPTSESPESQYETTPKNSTPPTGSGYKHFELKGGLPSVKTESVVGALEQVARYEKAGRPRLVGDLVTFKKGQLLTSLEGDLLRGSSELLSEQLGVVKRRDAFTGAMEYALIEDHDIHDTRLGLDKRITSGAIFQKVSFFSHGASVQIRLFEANMPLSIIPELIHAALGQLLLVDRMQNRSAKKMFLLCSSEKRLDITKLEEHFTDIVQSAGLLGIKIKFAVGPEGAAQAIADLVKINQASD